MKKVASLFIKGFIMGACDTVPGVSGGTAALLLGIYEQLIASLKALSSRDFWGALFRADIGKAWKIINGMFLLVVVIGMAAGIFGLAHSLEYLLHHYPVYVWSSFCGMILASAWVLRMRLKEWNNTMIWACVFGTAFSFWLSGLPQLQTPNTLPYFFLSGAIAISAMILPGISGSFLLVVMGKYQPILQAVTQLDYKILTVSFVGSLTGLLAFSHVLWWLLKRYHDVTIACLIGLMIGSLRKIWPWKETVEESGIISEVVERNVLPHLVSPEFFWALLWCVAGFLIVERLLGEKRKN